MQSVIANVLIPFNYVHEHGDRFCLYVPLIAGTGVPAALYLPGTYEVILEQRAAKHVVAADELRRLHAADPGGRPWGGRRGADGQCRTSGSSA